MHTDTDIAYCICGYIHKGFNSTCCILSRFYSSPGKISPSLCIIKLQWGQWNSKVVVFHGLHWGETRDGADATVSCRRDSWRWKTARGSRVVHAWIESVLGRVIKQVRHGEGFQIALEWVWPRESIWKRRPWRVRGERRRGDSARGSHIRAPQSGQSPI